MKLGGIIVSKFGYDQLNSPCKSVLLRSISHTPARFLYCCTQLVMCSYVILKQEIQVIFNVTLSVMVLFKTLDKATLKCGTEAS